MNDKKLLKIFGLNLKFERMKMGLTQESVAEKLNLSSVYISNVESGKCDLSLTNASKFANFYEKDIDFLLKDK